MLLQYLHGEVGLITVIKIVIISDLVIASSFLILTYILVPRIPRNLQSLSNGKGETFDDEIPEGVQSDCGESETETPTVKALYIHPIKSCKPLRLKRALLTKTGFAFDRCFAFAEEVKNLDADDQNLTIWRMISQRTKPQMSLIDVQIWTTTREVDHLNARGQVEGLLVIQFPDPDLPTPRTRLQALLETWQLSTRPQVRLSVPLMPSKTAIERYNIKVKDFNIHVRTAKGLDLGTLPEFHAALPKLKRFLKIASKQGLTLFRCTADTLHPTTLNKAPLQNIGLPAVHGYTDQQPIHIVNFASVRALSDLLPEENRPLNAARFRANIYIDGAPPYEEEEWKRCKFVSEGQKAKSNVDKIMPKLSVVCRTSRCTMPNVIPETGVFETETPPEGKKKGRPQPSTTLIEHRTVEDGNKAALGYLGMHCVPEDYSFKQEKPEQAGEHENVYIEVGDEVEVLERGVHLYGSTGDMY